MFKIPRACKIDFTFDETLHPSSTTLTTLDLAKILEGEYHIIQTFCETITPLLKERMQEMLKVQGKLNEQKLQSFIEAEWFKYGRSGKFGTGLNLKFTAAKKRSERSGKEVPFVDTGTYLNSMKPVISYKYI